MRTVEFPGLGLEFTFDNMIHIGSFEIAWYGVLIATGLLLAVLYGFKFFRKFGIDEDRAFYAVLAGVFGGVAGARIYYVIFAWESYGFDTSSFKAFMGSLYDIIATWEGGLAIYGAVIGALLCGGLVAWRSKIKLLPIFDITAIGFLIGQGIGRWGNFMNVEAFGSNTTLPWGMTADRIVSYLAAHQAEFAAAGITVDPNMPVHPCFLYESIWCLLGFAVLHFYSKRRRFDGEIFLMYLGWNGLGRSVIEGLRTDSLMIGSIRVSQLLAILMVVGSAVILVCTHFKIRGMHDDNYLKPYAYSEEWKAYLVEKAEKEKIEQSQKEKKLAKYKAMLKREKADKQEKSEDKADDKGEE